MSSQRRRLVTVPVLSGPVSIGLVLIGLIAMGPLAVSIRGASVRDAEITVRPSMLAAFPDSFAGADVRLTRARIVKVYGPRVFVIESQAPFRSRIERNRVLVFVQPGSVRADAAVLDGATVTVAGVARTLDGMRLSRDMAWPSDLTAHALSRLDVQAAIVARSVQTAEGVDLAGVN